MFCSSLCSTLVGILLAVMLDISGINAQIWFNASNPETPLPLNGPIKFQTIEGNGPIAYCDGNVKFHFPSNAILYCSHCTRPCAHF